MPHLEEILQQQYDTVAVLSQQEDKTVRRLRHKSLGTDLVCRSFPGTGEVYRTLLGVEHKGLPRVLEAICRQDRCLVLEEFVDGIPVSCVLEGGLYTVSGAKQIISSLCDALSVLHSLGIVHRDIKPEHLLVEPDGNVRLIDFDAARLYKPLQAGDTTMLGTVPYAAPEQFGVAQTDSRADIFAVGVLLNVMLTGVHPSVTLARGRAGKIIEKCVRIRPEQRYATAAALKRAVDRL